MSFEKELSVLDAVIRRAGEAVTRIASEGFETRDKGGDDPVTCADLAADRILREDLLAAFPDDGWLSEETADDLSRLDKKRVWIVDPVDGTREFVNNIPEYGISVALVEDGAPVVGAVLNPATDELVIGRRGGGVTLNGEPVAPHPFSGRPVLVSSRSEVRKGEFERFENDAEIRVMGSIAWKLALVAAGRADGVISMWGKNEWDIAAGVLLVCESGGRATDRGGAPFRFNRRVTQVEGIMAASAAAWPAVAALVRRTEEERS